MSGYGVCRWTCGECGDSYEADGVVGDHMVDRWMRDHKEMHRRQKLTREQKEQAAYIELLMWLKKIDAPQAEIDEVHGRLKEIVSNRA